MDIKKQNEQKKQYLRGYRMHARKIKRITAEIEEIRNLKMYPSLNCDDMPHGSNQNDLSSYAAELDNLERELYEEGIARVKDYKEIQFRINQLEDENERDVLFYRYIKGMSWWEIANAMNYSESWVYELHGRALKNLQIFKREESTGV